MSDGMLGTSLRDGSGPMQHLWQMLGGEQSEETFEALKRFLRKERDPWLLGNLVNSDLLEPVTTVSLPAVERFAAAGHFKEDGNAPGGVKLWISADFRAAFLGDNAKVETEVSVADLRVHCLRRGSLDAPIIAELGGETAVEVTLAHLWSMLEKQSRGQPGDLLVNGYANILYIRDHRGTLWAVFCRWDAGYGRWCVSADSVTYPLEWYAGYQVISR